MQITKRGEKALKESMMRRKDGTPRYSRGSLTEIARALWESLVEPAKIPLMDKKGREDIRDRNIRQLVDAIDQVYAKLKTASETAKKGEGGVPMKARYYQLLGYLSQVLSQVLYRADLDDVKAKLKEMEKLAKEIERREKVRQARATLP